MNKTIVQIQLIQCNTFKVTKKHGVCLPNNILTYKGLPL